MNPWGGKKRELPAESGLAVTYTLPRQPTDKAVTLFLPMPPSVNKLFRNLPNGGRAKTLAYRVWVAEAIHEVRRQAPCRIDGKYSITLTFGASRADVGNLEKAVNDLLQHKKVGVIQNDRDCRRIVLEWADDDDENEPKEIDGVRCIVAPFRRTAKQEGN